MNWLAFVFALEAGITPTDRALMVEPLQALVAESTCYQELEARIYLGSVLFFGGSVRAQEVGFSFQPFRLGTEFEAGLSFGELEIGARRIKAYPVAPFGPTYRRTGWDDACWQFYARIEFDTRKEDSPRVKRSR